jgi:hypothetical protein
VARRLGGRATFFCVGTTHDVLAEGPTFFYDCKTDVLIFDIFGPPLSDEEADRACHEYNMQMLQRIATVLMSLNKN